MVLNTPSLDFERSPRTISFKSHKILQNILYWGTDWGQQKHPKRLNEDK